MKWNDIWPYLLPLVAALAAGKFLRSLILWPFRWLARRTETKADDNLVDIAAQDLGVQSEISKLDGDSK